MLIFGHRGATGLEPENTISSFKKAEELGVDILEVDLRFQNGKIVLSHDKPKSDIATLDELLASTKLKLNLEIKESGFESLLLEKLKSFSSEVLISSKYPSILKKVRALDEKVQLGLILGRANFFLLPLVAKLDRSLNLYSVHPKTFLAGKTAIKYFKKLNKKIFVWTVNDPKRFEQLKELGVDGVFTDYPNIIKK